ncbi:ferredoxin--nitrite reductase, partial [Campylobacterota bacterium]
LKLYKLLTDEKRYEAVENFEPVLANPKKITRDQVSKLNPKVPAKLSEVIYNMTHHEKRNRAQVFSELLVALKEI